MILAFFGDPGVKRIIVGELVGGVKRPAWTPGGRFIIMIRRGEGNDRLRLIRDRGAVGVHGTHGTDRTHGTHGKGEKSSNGSFVGAVVPFLRGGAEAHDGDGNLFHLRRPRRY